MTGAHDAMRTVLPAPWSSSPAASAENLSGWPHHRADRRGPAIIATLAGVDLAAAMRCPGILAVVGCIERLRPRLAHQGPGRPSRPVLVFGNEHL
jgi:hypothetical protein